MWNTPTKKQLAQIPPLNSEAEVPADDIIIHLHFFMGAFDWYISEYDGQDIFFGFANLGMPEFAEWGTVSFQELKDVKNGFLEVDTDKYWQPKKFSEIERVQQILTAQTKSKAPK